LDGGFSRPPNSIRNSSSARPNLSFKYNALEAVPERPQSRGREKKGGERTLKAECADVAVQRFAPEPRGSLAFQRRVRVRRTFDRVEMAVGESLRTNSLGVALNGTAVEIKNLREPFLSPSWVLKMWSIHQPL